VLARVAGAALLALVSLAGWRAMTGQSRAARGLVVAMLIYNISATALLRFPGIALGRMEWALWPAVALHAVMAIWCIMTLLRAQAAAWHNNKGSE